MIPDDPFTQPEKKPEKPGGITQIWIGGEDNIPQEMREWMSGVRAYCNQFNLPYRCLNGRQCKALLDGFGIPFNPTGGIMSLTDMARVCALKKWGGWYLDTDVKIQRPAAFHDYSVSVCEQEPSTVFYNAITYGWMYNHGVLYASGDDSCLFLDAMLDACRETYKTVHASDSGWGLESTVQNMVHHGRQWVGWHQGLPKGVCDCGNPSSMINHVLYGTWYNSAHMTPGIKDAETYSRVSDL